MEGVKILNEISPMTAGVWTVIGLFLFIGIASLIWSFANVCLNKEGKILSVLISLFSIIIAAALFFSTYTSPMRYEVIVNDDVKISEFERKYEIVERRGDIYIVEEREGNER